MNPTRTREYVLELDVVADPIEGRVRDEAQTYDFTGWLGLATALERLISASASTDEMDKE
jgi:hypothetical protein